MWQLPRMQVMQLWQSACMGLPRVPCMHACKTHMNGAAAGEDVAGKCLLAAHRRGQLQRRHCPEPWAVLGACRHAAHARMSEGCPRATPHRLQQRKHNVRRPRAYCGSSPNMELSAGAHPDSGMQPTSTGSCGRSAQRWGAAMHCQGSTPDQLHVSCDAADMHQRAK